jgi:uncharacterized membrane protein
LESGRELNAVSDVAQEVFDMVTSFADLVAGRSEQTALLGASAVVPGTFARSLTPRSWIDQGVITGLAAGVTYLLTVITHDGIELVAAQLPVGGPNPAERQRRAVLLTNLAAIPVGFAVQRVLPRRPAEPTARGLARQAGWRIGVTGIAGAALAGTQGGLAAMDRRFNAGGWLARFPVAVPTGLGLALAVESQRHRREAAEATLNDEESAALVRSLGAAAGVVAVGTVLAYGERLGAGALGSAVAGRLPGSARLWGLAGHGVTLGAVVAGGATMYHRIIGKLEAGTTADDPTLDRLASVAGIPPTVTGSAQSLVPWQTLGREGRRHAVAGVRPEPVANRPEGIPDLSIPAVMSEPARATPVQVYVGLDSAPSAAARVQLALDEMDRAGAWDRSLIMLVSPTGTGYVNYCAMAAVQYLTRGDCAVVTLQYSKRPSPLSLGKIKDAREQNRLLWLRIVERLRDIPPDRRPRVVLFGESLGAHTSQDVFIHWGTLGPRALGIDRALWIGTPYASRWMQEVTGPDRSDVDAGLVAVVNDFQQIESMPADRRKRLRYVLLSHDNDGVTKFGADLVASRPTWLNGDRPTVEEVSDASPRGIHPSMRWRPVTTFVQLLVDMKNAQIPGVYRSWAHDYRPDLPRFIREVYDLPCSDEQLARIEAAVAEREALRKELFTGHGAAEPNARPS